MNKKELSELLEGLKLNIKSNWKTLLIILIVGLINALIWLKLTLIFLKSYL